jgi:hypothetical protein
VKRTLVVAHAVLAACGPNEVQVHDDYQDHDIGVSRQGLTVGGAGGCDTSIVADLTTQLVAEVNCIAPNAMVDFRQSNISVTSAVQPYLAPGASSALHTAVNNAGGTITISSAYRSLAQQYLLYKWWQAGQCGIQAAAVPGSSNHQSGRAIDVPSYNTWMNALTGQGWTWFGSGDVVHFDFLSAPNLGGDSVLAFQKLWNKNNTSQLVEDGVWGPNTENALASSPTTGFATYGCAPANGTLNGIAYAVNAADANDHSHLLSGVKVSAGGQSDTTGADGVFSLSLAPGSYMVTAHMSGYTDATASKTVSSSQTTTVNLGLKLPTMPDTTPPSIAVGDPMSGASLDAAAVTLHGTAADDMGPVAKVTVALNAGAPQDVTVSGGAFSVMLQLVPGANTVHLSAKDAAGNTGTLDVTLTFRSGVAGIVNDETGTPVVGAQIALEAADGTVKASVQTQSDGSYAIDFDAVPFDGAVTAQAPGFVDYRQAVQLTADNRLQLSFVLAHGTPGQAVRFVYPHDGDTVTTAQLMVSGEVNGFTPMKVTLNGQPAELMQGGRFMGNVDLKAGANVIEAVVDDSQSARITVTLSDSLHVRGGCAAVPGWMVPLVLVGLLLRRARRRES